MKKKLLIIILLVAFSHTKAQVIPNGGFEIWTNSNGYNVPESWGNMNVKTAPASIYTCTKGTPGSVGAAYLKLISKTVAGLGVIPAIAVSGTLDPVTMAYNNGFAINTRPISLSGKWQYMANGNDAATIKVFLTRLNPITQLRETVGTINQTLPGMVMSWGNFNFPVTYTSSETPDSCLIYLSASGAIPEAGSYLYIDALNLVAPLATENFKTSASFSVYPNPASSNLTLDLSTLNASPESIKISDLQGKIVSETNNITSEIHDIPISKLANGMYFINITTKEGMSFGQKFIKNEN